VTCAGDKPPKPFPARSLCRSDWSSPARSKSPREFGQTRNRPACCSSSLPVLPSALITPIQRPGPLRSLLWKRGCLLETLHEKEPAERPADRETRKRLPPSQENSCQQPAGRSDADVSRGRWDDAGDPGIPTYI